MTLKLIGITGKAGAGKDTVANILSELLPSQVIISPFAAPIKTAIAEIFKIDLQTLYDPVKKELPLPGFNVTARQAMQSLGTEWGRNWIDADIWLKLNLQRYEYYSTSDNEGHKDLSMFVIPDVRFKNEATWINNYGGILIQVTGREIEVPYHESENGCRVNPHYVIENSGGFTDLRNKVIRVLASILRN
jgi:energy-coupling factor transporter ATP-binding protein EcfA2